MNSGSSETLAETSRVFVVDDHPLVREGLANLINAQDDLIVCGEAEDSAQAIAGMVKTQPDVALIDISLPNESGLELVKHLAVQFPKVALIVLSMHDEALYAERALRAGARGYVMKRETSKSVLASIRRVLEGEDDVGRAGRGRQRRDQGADESAGALDHDRNDNHDGRRHRHLERKFEPEVRIGRHHCFRAALSWPAKAGHPVDISLRHPVLR